jgi:hypothetical protein
MKQLQNAAISGRLGQALPVVSEVEIARIERRTSAIPPR